VQTVADFARAADPRRVARAAAVTVVVLLVVGGAGALGIESFDFFRYDIGLTLPRVLVAAGLAGAAALAGLRLEAAPRAVVLFAVAGMIVLAIDELGALHERTGWSSAGSLVSAGVAAGVAAALAAAGPRRRDLLLASGGAAACWLVGHLLRLTPESGDTFAETLGGLFVLAGAFLFLVAALVAARSDRDVWGRSRDRTATEIAAGLVERVEPLSAAVAIALAIVALGVLGSLVVSDDLDSRLFNLNREHTVPAYFSGALLLAAGLLAYLVRRTLEHPRACVIVAIILVGLGFDEIIELHEKFQLKFDVWGQAALLPLAVVGFVAWLLLLRDLWEERLFRALFVASPVVWIVSQGIDAVFRPSDTGAEAAAAIVPEEALEMVGSALMLFAWLVLIQAWQRQGRFGRLDAGRPVAASPAGEPISAPGRLD
jgi:hypothetical protein